MDIRVVAQALIDELKGESLRKNVQAEGVVMLYNKLVEVADAEEAGKSAVEPTNRE